MFGGLLLFKDSFVNIIMISFSALICVELLNITTSLHKFRLKMLISILGSLAVYVVSILLLHSYFNLSKVDGKFLAKILMMTVIAWLPIHGVDKIMNCIDPSSAQKVVSGVKKVRIDMQ